MIIYKYHFKLGDTVEIEMPLASQILSVQIQNGMYCLWALIDQEITTVVKRKLAIRGTGNPIKGSLGRYIATIQNGLFVWHVFDLGEHI